MGCSIEHPLKLRKNYRFFAAFFFAPLAAFFAIVFSSGLATQPPTNHLAVTTGGLSHPPSYQMEIMGEIFLLSSTKSLYLSKERDVAIPDDTSIALTMSSVG